ILGEVKLTVKVSMAPLEEDQRGISIYANGGWYETNQVGIAGREMAQYIFGDIDVPALDADTSPIAPYDLTRTTQLNPENPTVRSIYQFIGPKIDMVRRELVEADKRRREEEDARRLAEQANEIARVINNDFNEFRDRLSRVRASSTGGIDVATEPEQSGTGNGDGDFVVGGDEPAEVVSPEGALGAQGNNGRGGEEPRTLNPIVEPGGVDSESRGHRARTDRDRRT